jgi:hypothetical protein
MKINSPSRAAVSAAVQQYLDHKPADMRLRNAAKTLQEDAARSAMSKNDLFIARDLVTETAKRLGASSPLIADAQRIHAAVAETVRDQGWLVTEVRQALDKLEETPQSGY